MPSRHILRLHVLLTAVLADPAIQAAYDPPKAGCEIELVSRIPSKPPANRFVLKLTLRNAADEPRWFVAPYFGNDRLKSDMIRFYPRPAGDPPFGSSRYRGRGGDTVVVGCHGSVTSSESFNAVLLPARGEVVFEDYEVMTFGETLEGLEISEVGAILVNGETPLERWLPYPTISASRAIIPKGRERELLDFDRRTYKTRTDYPVVPATAVHFKGVSKTFLKLRP